MTALDVFARFSRRDRIVAGLQRGFSSASPILRTPPDPSDLCSFFGMLLGPMNNILSDATNVHHSDFAPRLKTTQWP